MSQKDMELLEKLRALPERTQERFLDKLDGAIMSFDDVDSKKERLRAVAVEILDAYGGRSA